MKHLLVTAALIFALALSHAAPIVLEEGYLVNRRPETLFNNVVSDLAYVLCKDEIKKDFITGAKLSKATHYIPTWKELANGLGFFLPLTEIRKLSVGDNCVLQKSFEILRLERSRGMLP